MEPAPSPVPARLVRSAHDENGLSVFTFDDFVPSFTPPGVRTNFKSLDTRVAVPVDNTVGALPAAKAIPRCPPGGATFAITDMAPGGRAPLHRTESLDYCVVVSGEIVMRLDSGQEKTVRAGEFIIQQGANHEWINRGEETCRMVFVMLSADKIRLDDGRVLEETLLRR